MCEMQIDVNTDLTDFNERLAAENQALLHSHGIRTLNIMGSPGSGKTTLLENLLPILAKRFRIAVIEGDLATRNDADRIEKMGITACQINTDGGCHLDAHMVHHQLEHLPLDDLDLVIIENVGNLVCPISFALGEDFRLVVLSTAEGEDKPLKYPTAMVKTDAVVISKTDLAPFVDVSVEKMTQNIKSIHPDAAVLYAGKKDGVYDCIEVAAFVADRIGK